MTIIPSECRVALLAGGTSGERDISIASGKSACKALEAAGFDVCMLDPAQKDDLKRLMDESFDVAFLSLHGRKGEDGAIQGFLEMIGLPYTGSGIQSSAIAMDKAKSKMFYELAGIPTSPSVTLHKGDGFDASAIVSELGAHCVVKPATEGSSLGVKIVEDEEALGSAIESAFAFDDVVLVEKFIEGMEVTIAILGNEDPVALPVIQMVPKNDFYDFESKYAPGGSQHICPASLSDELTKKVQGYARKAHLVLGCHGVSRTDFIIDDQDECWILETNTIPGMTETSLLPDAARVDGISFPELCTKLVAFALE